MAKESLYHLDKNVVSRLTFNSEQDSINNGFTPVSISYVNGVGIFNNTTSYGYFRKPLKGTNYTIRIKCNITALNVSDMYLMDNRADSGTGYIYLSSTGVLTPSGGTKYINGAVATTVSLGVSSDIVVTGITLDTYLTYIGRYNESVGGLLNGSIELIEIYDRILSADEVLNLYNKNLYIKPSLLKNTLVNVNPNRGLYDITGKSFTNTAVTLVNDDPGYVGYYNGTTSLLSFPSTNGEFSFTAGQPFSTYAWIKLRSQPSIGFICCKSGPYPTGEWAVYIASNGSIYLDLVSGNNYANRIGRRTALSVAKVGTWIFVVTTYDGSGLVSGIKVYAYQTGVLTRDTLTNSGGTFVAMTPDNALPMRIGGRTAGEQFPGLIGDAGILNKVLSAAEIASIYNSTKRYYNE